MSPLTALGSRLTRSSHLALAVLPLLVALGVVRAAEAAVCSVADLCPAPSGNCTPAKKLECDSPAIFDLGGRPLVIPADKSLTVSHGDGNGSLHVLGAASLSLQGKIAAQGGDNDSGQVVIETNGPVTLAAGSTIDVSATLDGGFIEIDVQSGDLQANGLLKASSGRDGEGGEVTLTALAGGVTVGGLGINASASGEFSGGGSVELSASADVSLQGPVELTGGDAGELTVDADSSIVTGVNGDVEASATTAGGLGGSVSFLAGVDVRLAGEITATAPGNDDEGGGLGGEVLIVADTGSVEIDDQLDLRGSGPDGEGGSVDVTAAVDVTIAGAVRAGIAGGGFGGSIISSAGGRTSLASSLDVAADDFGGVIKIETGDTLTVQGTLRADATGSQGTGGQNALRACTLLVVREGIISATGAGTSPDASNLLQASGQMTISGTLTAGDRNVLEYRDTPPTIGSGAVIDPEEDIAQNPGLPCCGDTCTTTTTTTRPSTTTTSSTTTTTVSTTTTTVPVCGDRPRPSCRRPVESEAAQLKLKDSAKGPAKDQLQWKWTKGAATSLADFADPVTSDGLVLCIFDRSQTPPRLLFQAIVPPDGMCGTKPKPCWVGKSKNFKFASKTPNSDGVRGLTLTPGAPGKAKIEFKAKGAALTRRPFGLPAPPLPLPLTVQLQSENGNCWEASYALSGVKKNAGEDFEAKSGE
jgi:hypothetical protein